MKLYESLPPEAKQSLEHSKKVIKSVTHLQSKYGGIPTLDLKGKKKELYGLLDDLARDSKRAIIVDSMLNWLNDIWTVVYEYNVNFDQAHACLLFVAEILSTLNSIPKMGGCTLAYPSVNLAIRRKGKIIKQFRLAGPRGIDRALLWIWRDLFVSMFAKNIHTEKIPEMLSDIEESLGWQSLERMLYGGFKKIVSHVPQWGLRTSTDDEEDEGDFFDEEGYSWRCPCRLHASHWSKNINTQRTNVRDLVYEHLLALFELTPSQELYMSILSVSPDAEETETELLGTLSQIAGSSADTLVAALEIHGSEANAGELMDLLDEHAYLLRARDAPVLQNVKSSTTAAALRAAVRSAFCHVEKKACVDALVEITKLRSDNPGRTHRIEAWVDSVVTPGSTASHPMAFAAMIMGFPLAAGMDDSDEMDDAGDLRDEFRPKLRERFEGWVSTAAVMKGGSTMLGKVYFKIVEEMPYFKVHDIAEEMLNRLSDSPSKAHITDGFDAVMSFCKSQRKKMSMRAEKRRKNEAAKKAAAA
ncbi:hypothetical protein B0H14DRAFT_3082191 [Mycena olivaceomarginata]|nr:hypothetical protein B0H14DRAFT_3082191 [Mycena olivaceomarginata]